MAGSQASAGAVAAGHAVTAAAATEVLSAGGNAFDAAIAALWAACVAEPVLASPAGGGFLIAKPSGGETQVFDFFVATPHNKAPIDEIDFHPVHADFGTTTQEFHIGSGAVATPGFVPGLFAVHRALASLAMTELVAPAVRAARDGVEITAFQADLARIVAPIVTASRESRAQFAPGGTLIAEGQTVCNPALSETLQALASEGPDLIRGGALADAIITEVASRGGHLTHADLATYEVACRPPLTRDVGGALLAINPPPAAGGVLVALILALAGTVTVPDPVNLALAIAEADAIRRAGLDGLPAVGDNPPLADALAEIAQASSPRGTTHVSVVDAQGNAAAATVSNGEGNGQMVAGFMLNNMLGEEDINPGGFHAWEPGIRPASMMAPALLQRDGGVVALGSGGSNRIRSAIAGVIARLVTGQPLAEAIAAARLHIEHGHLDFEDFLTGGERTALIARFGDHRAWTERSLFFGGVHAAARHADGRLEAVGDPRRAGVGVVAVA